jgi:hypothetical protein
MSEPLPRLIKGAAGRVTFQHLNTVFDAVDRYNRESKPGAKPGPGRRTYVAKLSTTNSTSAVTGYTTWNWTGVSVASGALGTDADLVASADFQTGSGTALDIDGGGTANAIVLLHEVVTDDGKRYFAFKSPSGTSVNPNYLITSTATDATGATPSWVYTLTPITGFSSGSWTASGSTVRARNLAEDQTYYQHGQDLSLASGDLTPAVVTGPVQAWYTGLTESSVALYAFDVLNPMTVTCP